MKTFWWRTGQKPISKSERLGGRYNKSKRCPHQVSHVSTQIGTVVQCLKISESLPGSTPFSDILFPHLTIENARLTYLAPPFNTEEWSLHISMQLKF